MKRIVIVPDGVGDWPLKELGNKTPLQAASKPNLDDLSRHSILGTLKTCPDGMYPGSDVCGLSLMGYDPKCVYTGRAPLEAANIGIVLKPGELAFRCNLVSEEKGVLTDYSADHITTEEAQILIEELQKNLGNNLISFHTGKMYRHIMCYKRAVDIDCTTDQPHDFQGTPFASHWPSGKGSEILIDLTNESKKILTNHPINQKRLKAGKKPANMIWLWGGGPAPKLEHFETRYGIKGGVISAVDLLNGLGRYLGWEIISVPGATGYFDTDYQAKGRFAIEALKRLDLVFVHVEATDEAGHMGNVKEKIRAIENIDKFIVGPIVERLKEEKEWRLFVAPDHYTPIVKKTHVAEPVPFIFAGSDLPFCCSERPYTEPDSKATGIALDRGYELMLRLVKGWQHYEHG
ncbi:MAG: cofactor-independent phosphoglycerate mutase [Omnitrophica bacterium RIFCSPLOWO2_01_FULL_45_10b]|nr:MAG: cofactor-independent phosphoglycerate mutase [Omnitrophica bacterium RIFCSPLOWO2_01_FULL_45_10b]